MHRRQDVVDHQLLVRQLMDHLNDKDLQLVRHQYAVGNYLDRLYLQDVLADIGEVNQVWREYMGTHPVVRRAYGVTLQSGMRVEAAFTAEIP